MLATLRMEKETQENIPERGDDLFAADSLRQISEEISSEFPPPRLGTELVLLEVDPRRAHAYWNIDVEDYKDAQLDSGSKQPTMVLRMYDITGVNFDGSNARETFDTEIQGLQGHWYVDLWQHGRKYVADLGFRRGDGSLAFIARSNEVETPQEGPSSSPDVGMDLVSVSAPEAVAGEGPPAARLATLAILPRETVADAKADFIEGDYPREYGAPVAAPVENSPVDLHWPEPDEHEVNSPEVQKKIDTFYKEMAGPESAISLEESRAEQELKGDSGVTEMPTASPEAVTPPSPAPNAPVSLDNYINYSSFEPGRQNVELEVNTELHIYGRAKPGSNLTLFGQKVQLRPDGTFSVRKPLPQGAVVIPLLFTPNGEGT